VLHNIALKAKIYLEIYHVLVLLCTRLFCEDCGSLGKATLNMLFSHLSFVKFCAAVRKQALSFVTVHTEIFQGW